MALPARPRLRDGRDELLLHWQTRAPASADPVDGASEQRQAAADLSRALRRAQSA